MKTKMIIGVLLLAGICSCTDEMAREKETPVPVPEGKAVVRLTFTIGKTIGTKSTIRSYADEPATDEERQLDSVRVYVFDQATQILENVLTVKDTDLGGTQGSDRTADILLSTAGDKEIVAVGNPLTGVMPALGETPVGMARADFNRLSTKPVMTMPTAPFVMVDEQTVTVTLDASVNATFNFYRLVSRIDILNRDSVGMNAFELQYARLLNTNTSAVLWPNKDTVDLGANLFVDPVWIENAGTYKGAMSSVLYAYPSQKEKSILEIKGTYNGQTAYYQIPFSELSADVKTNHRYIVQIDSVTTAQASATIKVTDWASDTISFDPVAGTMSVQLTTPAPYTLGEYTGVDQSIPDTLYLKSNAVTEIGLTIENENLQADVQVAGGDWVTVEQEITTYALVGQAVTLKVAKNTTGVSRSLLVSIESAVKNNPQVQHYLIVQPEKSPLVLERWATSNLTGYKTPTQFIELTDATAGLETNYGAWFQWGRNAAFTNAATIPVGESNHPGPVAPTAAIVSGTNFITASSSYNYVWYTGYVIQDTWRKITGKTQSVPLGTDPCPDGWRLPTADEIAAIVPVDGTSGTFSTSANTNYAAESTTATYYTDEGTQVTANYSPASYFTGGSTIRYGIKRQGHDDAAIFKWEYGGSSLYYLKISSLSVEATFDPGTTATAITAEFTNRASEAVVRYFPAAGCRHPSEGTVGVRGTSGYYWSSSSHSSTSQSAWSLSFASGSAYLYNSNRAFGFSVRCVSEN
ncbi:MAG: FISUMP domain-containing protein [Massilibacteroides sp.]|nr:FISUMP domain-containing protein [Massilibacteroides sp.]